MKNWPMYRRREMAALQELLNEACSINSGSHCLSRIQRVITLAKRLNSLRLRTGRASFMGFLIQEAHKDGCQTKRAKR